MAGAVLSKSKYLSGLQCPKKLWTEVHARQRIPAVDSATQARFDQGHDVGSVAKGLYPGGLEIGPGVRRWDRVVADTQRALTQRRPLYEAAFRSGGAACRVDILAPVGTDQWDVLEVKSSTGVKEVHLADLALQSFVLEGSGLRIRDYFLVHLDTSYSRSGDLDSQTLFHRQRVTDEVAERRQNVASDLERMQQVLGSGSCPEITIGKHCNEPYGCALKPECWAFLPPSNVFDLTRGRQRGFELLARGIEDLKDIPVTSDLTVEQRIQLEAVRQGEPHVDSKALRTFLRGVSYPTSYFDIETMGPAIPLFDKSRPYEQIPFLFSIHRIEGPGQRARHFAYMYGGQEDPRPDFLRAARTALGDFGSIVAYNASFEKRILRESAASVLPELEDWAVGLKDRFVDLLAPFQKFAYHHPDQQGSASLKRVLPPLTGMSYADLEIADGSTASSEYLRVISTEVDAIERAEVLAQLEDYCSLDTLGMVEVVEKLADLSAE
jgi:hypothetical protein